VWKQKAGRIPAFDRQKLVPRLRRAFMAGGVALIAIALTFAGLSAANQAR